MTGSGTAERFLDWAGNALQLVWLGALGLALVGLAWTMQKFGVSGSAAAALVAWLVLIACVAWLTLRQRYILAMGLVALARIGVYFLTDGAVPTSPDAHFYDSLARSLANGRELPTVIDGVTFLAHAPRLHAYLLAIVYFITNGSSAGPPILNFLFDGLTAAVIFRAGTYLGGDKRLSAVAALSYLLWPHVMLNSVFAQKESLACLLVTSACYLLLRAWIEGKIQTIRYGILLGLLGFTQPAFFLMVGGLQLILFWRLRAIAVVRTIALTSLTATLTLLPWIIRNWILLDGFVPLTTGAGMNMYVNAAGNYDFPDQFNALPERVWNSRMLIAAFSIIVADPWVYTVHQVKMMSLGLGLEHMTYQVWETMKPPPALKAQDTILVTQSALIGLWALASALTYVRRSHTFFLLLFTLVFTYIATVAIWFEFGSRHRAYFLPLLLLWASTSAERAKPAKITRDGRV